MLIRTRFAPSPTGFLHVGGIRTALFAWLIARQNDGQFILRLEDTDKKREVTGSDQHIFKSLKALGINWDEGPDIGGQYKPYRQSQRLDIYKKWAHKLIDAGRAYPDPYSAKEVQSFKEQAIKNKQPFLYRKHRPSNPPKWDGTQPLRFKSDPKKYTWQDIVMGKLSAGADVIDDFIIIKPDGYPTYNFAHIIDDFEMKISHIIRGQEFIASMPNYLNLYEALNIKPPIFATMPHILNEQGNKKLSKRDAGAKDVLGYIKKGYLPEALQSFIATLGWNDGSKQEIFTTQQLIDKFKLNRVGKSGAQFDERRLTWVNGYFIRQLSLDELFKLAKDYLPTSAGKFDVDYKKQVLAITQERLKYFAELPMLTNFFFEDLPLNPELISSHKQLKKITKEDQKILLQTVESSLMESDFSANDLKNRLNALLTITHTKPVILFSLIRIATTQAPASPQLTDTLQIIGKNASLRRIRQQIESLS